MSVPIIVDDGNYRIAQQDGYYDAERPFASKGDIETFVIPVHMIVDSSYFKLPKLMSQRRFPWGVGYLVDISPQTTIRGHRLWEFDLIYASVPKSRTEFGSVTATVNVVNLDGITILATYTDVFDAQIRYDYQLLAPPPKLIAPAGNPSFTVVSTQGFSTITTIPGQAPILAANSTSSIYMGQIYERKAFYFEVPNITQLPAA